MLKAWDNAPVFDDHQAWLKLMLERREIAEKFSASNIKIVLNLSSDATGETHAFPIFNSDTFDDLCNRYGDLFPLELKQCIQEVEEINRGLTNQDGMSKERLNMGQLKLPLNLYTILSTYDPQFWQELDGLKIRKLRAAFGKFKIGLKR